MTFKLLISRINRDIAITIVGTLLVSSVVLAGWLPRTCPLLVQVLNGCPVPNPTAPLNARDIELARIPHQDVVTPQIYFTHKAQDYRAETLVNFTFTSVAPDETAELQLKYAGGYRTVALITQPVLKALSWPSYSADGIRMLQPSDAYASIDDLLGHLPAANALAADTVAARQLGLKENSYQPLESLSSNKGITVILTSQPALRPDGILWNDFSKEIDATDALVNVDGDLEWIIARTGKDTVDPFRISTVHIDYQKMVP